MLWYAWDLTDYIVQVLMKLMDQKAMIFNRVNREAQRNTILEEWAVLPLKNCVKAVCPKIRLWNKYHQSYYLNGWPFGKSLQLSLHIYTVVIVLVSWSVSQDCFEGQLKLAKSLRSLDEKYFLNKFFMIFSEKSWKTWGVLYVSLQLASMSKHTGNMLYRKTSKANMLVVCSKFSSYNGHLISPVLVMDDLNVEPHWDCAVLFIDGD